MIYVKKFAAEANKIIDKDYKKIIREFVAKKKAPDKKSSAFKF